MKRIDMMEIVNNDGKVCRHNEQWRTMMNDEQAKYDKT